MVYSSKMPLKKVFLMHCFAFLMMHIMLVLVSGY